MDQPNKDPSDWETQAQVDACLATLDVSPEQVNRWRREGLLPDVLQVPDRYHGSHVVYPAGTCKQIDAAARLYKIKHRAAYVGWQLWLDGYPVDEKYWRPFLIKTAGSLDHAIASIKKYLIKDEARQNGPTLQERAARSRFSNIIVSRIRRRQTGAALATTMATIIDVATGRFDQFPVSDAVEGDDGERARVEEALDMGASKDHLILGQQLTLTKALPGILSAMSRSFREGDLLGAVKEPDSVIFSARNDVRNVLRIAEHFYNATKWIYGPRAFGLRLAAWMARKRPDLLVRILILGFVRLRQSTDELYSSDEICRMADQAELAADNSKKIQELARNQPWFGNVVSARRFRVALQDPVSFKKLVSDIHAARNSSV